MVFIRETKLAGRAINGSIKAPWKAAASGEIENLQRPDPQEDIDSHDGSRWSALASSRAGGGMASWLSTSWEGEGRAGRGRGEGVQHKGVSVQTSYNPAATPAARQALYHCTDRGSENGVAWPRLGGLNEIIHRTECSELRPISSVQ